MYDTYPYDDKALNACFALIFLAIGLLLALVFMVVFVIIMSVSPLRLTLVPMAFIHETGHAVTCIATGGTVVDFVVEMNGNGHISRSGGDNTLVLASGALATAIIGAVLLIVPYLRVCSVFLGYHGAMNMLAIQGSDGYWLFTIGQWWVAYPVMAICIIVSLCAIYIMQRNVMKFVETSTISNVRILQNAARIV